MEGVVGVKRRIKFRGKCAGTWRKGDHLTYANGEAIRQWSGSLSPEYDVEPETVGQFTGLYDCDGNEIYEGDFVELTDYSVTLLIGWDDYDCKLTFFKTDGNPSAFELHQIGVFSVRVIGNAFDNPELFERSGLK